MQRLIDDLWGPSGRDRHYAFLRLRELGARAAPVVPLLLCEIEMNIERMLCREDCHGPWLDDDVAALTAIGAPAVAPTIDAATAPCAAPVGRARDGRPCRNPQMDVELCSWRRGLLARALEAQGPPAVPQLTDCLVTRPANGIVLCAEVLRALGPAARTAAPVLRQKTEDARLAVRSAAKRALLAIEE